jgi:hypothetical protein
LKRGLLKLQRREEEERKPKKTMLLLKNCRNKYVCLRKRFSVSGYLFEENGLAKMKLD